MKPDLLTYRQLKEKWLRETYPQQTVAVIHYEQVESDNVEEFLDYLKQHQIEISLGLFSSDLLILPLLPESMVEFVNNFPEKFCYVEGWENGECVTENT